MSRLTVENKLPIAKRDRWQPLRSGLVNLYRYENDEFRFEDGHLLLRGNNGTGKSRVLALQLPFLLDGEVAPHRLEPDGDPAKRIEWNLLLGKHADRRGYTWVEFGRVDGDGQEQYLTLGCGLMAVEGRGLVGKWFIVTPLRVGRDFEWVSGNQTLTKERLAEVLGDRGEILTTATEYRARVDAKMFQLGAHRYHALVDLLIQLRQPQLSRQLDETKLSDALGRALPPLDDAVLADVAESFRSLETDRSALERLVSARLGVDTFLTEYRRYCQIAALRRATAVRTSNSAYESTARKLRSAETGLAAARQELDALTRRLDELMVEQGEADAAIQVLSDSPEMSDAKVLDRARTVATERQAEFDGAEDRLERLLAKRDLRAVQRDTAAAAARGSRERLQVVAERAAERAAEAGLDRAHAAAIVPLNLPDIVDALSIDGASRDIDVATASRRDAVRRVRELGAQVERATTEQSAARREQESLAAQLEDGFERKRDARTRLDRAVADLIAAFNAWCEGLKELVVDDADTLQYDLVDWCEATRGPSPVAKVVSAAHIDSGRVLATARAVAEQRLQEAQVSLAALREEREQLVLGVHVAPLIPHTRTAAIRDTRPGAPLWQLCDFSNQVSASDRARIEAALEAAGLLDAWVTPDGTVLSGDDDDVVLVTGQSALAPADAHLGVVMIAAIDHGDARTATVSSDVVEAVLRHIGLGVMPSDATACQVWVGRDGRFQLGPLSGRWSKPTAQHIGQGARAADRRLRLEVIGTAIAAAEAAVAAVHEELQGIENRERTVAKEYAAAPEDAAVRAAVAAIEAASRMVDSLRQRVTVAEEKVAIARRKREAVLAERDHSARDLGIAAWVDRLDQLEQALGAYRETVASLWPMLVHHIGLTKNSADAAIRFDEARDDWRAADNMARDAEVRARAAKTERDTLVQSIGSRVEDVLERLTVARTRAGQIRGERDRASESRTELRVSENGLVKDIERFSEILSEDERRRDDAVGSIVRFAQTRLFGVADPALADVEAGDWSSTRAVDVARRVTATLERMAADDAAWERRQKEIHSHFSTLQETLLQHEYEPSATLVDAVFVVVVPFQGRLCSMAELLTALDEESHSRRSLLDAREREILENHLIGEVSAHLHARLHEGEEWVRQMNAELEARPTSTGMTLRFAWLPIEDGPAGLIEARKRLLSAASTWSQGERQAIGEFLQARIQSERTGNDTGTWQEHLQAALDYRAWHRFAIERRQDGVWKRLTRRTHGTGSGGEKAIALTLPLFAAAAAHYRTTPLAPRLILLDEAFVGIDTDMRGKCMALLAAFDLDFMMTSEREWGCYGSLPGVAIVQLSARPGIDAVGITRWVWNGRERLRDERAPVRIKPVVKAVDDNQPMLDMS